MYIIDNIHIRCWHSSLFHLYVCFHAELSSDFNIVVAYMHNDIILHGVIETSHNNQTQMQYLFSMVQPSHVSLYTL